MAAVYAADDPSNWTRSRDDVIAEDECTFVFGEEEEVGGVLSFPGGPVFREYGGEDFSKYLRDDDDDVYNGGEVEEEDDEEEVISRSPAGDGRGHAEESKSKSVRRYRKHKNGKRSSNAVAAADEGRDAAAVAAAGKGPSSSTGRKKSLDGLRERLSHLMQPSTGAAGRRGEGVGGAEMNNSTKSSKGGNNRMQNYSFTDLRIGQSLLNDYQVTAGRTSAPSSLVTGSDSGSEIRSQVSIESRSDLGLAGERSGSSWWNIETLSDRHGGGKITPLGPEATSDGIKRRRGLMGPSTLGLRRKTKSVPDLLDDAPRGRRPDSSDSDNVRVHGSGSSGSGSGSGLKNGDIVNCWGDDVRVSAAPELQGRGKLSLWKRLTRSTNRTRLKSELRAAERLPPPIEDRRPLANDPKRTSANETKRPLANELSPHIVIDQPLSPTYLIPMDSHFQSRSLRNEAHPPPNLLERNGSPPTSPTFSGIYEEIKF